jgi:glycosyltransferase involved in cell wall biosynthesis
VTDVDSSIPDQIRYSGFARRGPLPWFAGWLERHALRHSVAAVTVCRSLTDGVRDKAPGLPVFQIEDPPLVDPEQPLQEDAAATLRMGWAADDETERPVVLYSGNFESYQGVELLVEAAALLPALRFVFMGGEPSEIERLRARTEALGVAARCVFTGKRAPEELPRFLAAADILVSPRIEGENTPFKIFTYLASGKPVVATRIPTHTQLLDEATAFLAEPTPAGLAEAIERALSSPEDARARAQHGREFIAREYGPRRHVEKVAAAYAEIARLAS